MRVAGSARTSVACRGPPWSGYRCHTAGKRQALPSLPSAPVSGIRRPYVAVVGGSSADADACTVAEAVGGALGRRGAVVVCGGLGGVMEAACRGARAAGGLTVGLLPGDDRREANEFVDVAIPTGMGEARNALVVRAADVVIAIGGEFGTLSEIALALRTGKQVVGLSTWELAREGQAVDAIVRVSSAEDAVDVALGLLS